MTQPNKQRDEMLDGIAKCVLEVPTLRERGSDGLDFHEISVWGLREALQQAYEAGAKQAPAHARDAAAASHRTRMQNDPHDERGL